MSGTTQSAGRPAARFRVPRAGKLWLLIALVFWGTGIFKAFNLITLLACLMLVIWGFNAVSARHRLRNLRLRRWAQGPIFANTPAVLEAEVYIGGNSFANHLSSPRVLVEPLPKTMADRPA